MRYRFFNLQPHRDPDSGGGTGGGGGTQTTQTPASTGDGRQDLQGLLTRHNNDAMAVVATLLTENHSLRDERRTLRGQLPAQGAVVLPPEDVTRWQAYQQLGQLDQITTALKERETDRAELTGLKRDLELRDVATVAGYSLDVLRTLAGDLAFAVKDETKDGKAVKAVYVKDGDKEVLLDDYAKTKWAAFLPALKPQAATAQPARGTPRQVQQLRQGQGEQSQEQPRKSVVRL